MVKVLTIGSYRLALRLVDSAITVETCRSQYCDISVSRLTFQVRNFCQST